MIKTITIDNLDDHTSVTLQTQTINSEIQVDSKVLSSHADVFNYAPVTEIRTDNSVQVVSGPKGDTGIQGLPGNVVTKTAGQAINSGQAVMINSDGLAYVFDITNEANYGKFAGVARNSATTGNTLTIYVSGEAVEPGSGWLPGLDYYVGTNGYLTTNPPVSGIQRLIGAGSAIDSIIINNNLDIVTI